MAMDMDDTTIDFRLRQIEKSIEELKNVLVQSKIQEHDINTMQCQQNDLKDSVKSLESRVTTIENRPVHEKAQKWQYISDFIFKTCVSAAVIGMLVKFGVGA